MGNDFSDSDHGTKLFLGNRDISDISRTSEAPIAICSQGDHLALVTDHSTSDVNQSFDLLSAKLPKSASGKHQLNQIHQVMCIWIVCTLRLNVYP